MRRYAEPVVAVVDGRAISDRVVIYSVPAQMDDIEIIATLSEIMQEDSEHYRRAQQTASRAPMDFREVLLMHALAKPLGEVLSKQPEFAAGGFMIHQPNGGSGFHASEAATALLRRARKGENPQRAVEWLTKVITTERANVLCVMALWGVSVNDRVQLGQGVELVPLEQVPPSRQRDRVLGPVEFTDIQFAAPWMWKPPKAGLAVTACVDPFITKATTDEGSPAKDQLRYHNLLDDVRLGLTCVGPCAPLQAASWFQYEDPDLEDAAVYKGTSGTLHEILPSGFEPEVSINTADAQAVISAFLALSGKTLARVRVSLERLNQALRRRAAGDYALELSIALEALLAEGQGENAYKVALRAGLLSADDAERRAESRGIIGAVYSLRSALVHNGRAPEMVKVRGKGQLPATDIVQQGASITATVIREVIRRGEIPNWYALELNPL